MAVGSVWGPWAGGSDGGQPRKPGWGTLRRAGGGGRRQTRIWLGFQKSGRREMRRGEGWRKGLSLKTGYSFLGRCGLRTPSLPEGNGFGEAVSLSIKKRERGQGLCSVAEPAPGETGFPPRAPLFSGKESHDDLLRVRGRPSGAGA